MSDAPKWRRYLRFWRHDVAADVDDELRFHLEARTEELIARGHAPADARRAALAEFGDVEATRRGLREIGERRERRRERASWWSHARSDVAYALRGLAATPGFTVGVVITLAVGIGAAAGMYGTMQRLLRQPPPHVVAPGELRTPFFHYTLPTNEVRTYDRLSYPLFERVQARGRSVSAIAAYQPDVELVVGTGADAHTAHATLVSPGFWRALGVRPLLGRAVADVEAHPESGDRVAVLGHAFWQRRYAGDSSVVGATLHVRGRPYRIVGVAPRGFRGVELTDTDVWLPLLAAADGVDERAGWHQLPGDASLRFVVRLATGAPASRAAAELSREHALLIAESAGADSPESEAQVRTHVSLHAVAQPLDPRGRRLPAATITAWLAGVAGVLLAIACANVASLLLLRALRRRREISVRLALGMSRRRLAALLLTESTLLALLGGAGAVVVAAAGSAWVRRTLLPGMIGESAGIDGRLAALSAATVILIALLTGLAPVLQTRRDVAPTLRERPQHGGPGRSALHRALLATQIALSAALLVGAGLFLRSLHRATAMDLGMDYEHAYRVTVDFVGSGRAPREVAAFHEGALERVRALPGVESASLIGDGPPRHSPFLDVRLEPGGARVRADDAIPSGRWVADDYLAATGMRLVAGRALAREDRTGAPAVVVNEAFARLAWPGRTPLGECVYLSTAADACARVVGVVGDTRSYRRRTPRSLLVYSALPPDAVQSRSLVVRVSTVGGATPNAIAGALRQLDPAVPYVEVEALGAALAPQLRPWRLGATVFTAFGTIAALLAALGLHTAMAYAVAQRTREIGVRLAMGAAPPSVLGLVVRDAARIAATGIVLGLGVAAVSSGRLRDLLFETSPHDPLVLGGVAVAVLAASCLASVAPAWRAMRVDPTTALRTE